MENPEYNIGQLRKWFKSSTGNNMPISFSHENVTRINENVWSNINVNHDSLSYENGLRITNSSEPYLALGILMDEDKTKAMYYTRFEKDHLISLSFDGCCVNSQIVTETISKYELVFNYLKLLCKFKIIQHEQFVEVFMHRNFYFKNPIIKNFSGEFNTDFLNRLVYAAERLYNIR